MPVLLAALAEGLALIAEHVIALERAIDATVAPQASAAIRVVSEEEAGKYLVLLDAARCARAPIGTRTAQLKRANEHLAKGIYARAAELRPASFGELLGCVQPLRESHYLDGPIGVEWIFRNEIEAQREGQLYVDYVATDDGDFWQSPGDRNHLLGDPPSDACRLVAALHRAGFSTAQGLEVVNDVWHDFAPEPDVDWRELQPLVAATIARVSMETDVQADHGDVSRIAQTWPYPLWHVDLTRIHVEPDELRGRRDNWHPDV